MIGLAEEKGKVASGSCLSFVHAEHVSRRIIKEVVSEHKKTITCVLSMGSGSRAFNYFLYRSSSSGGGGEEGTLDDESIKKRVKR